MRALCLLIELTEQQSHKHRNVLLVTLWNYDLSTTEQNKLHVKQFTIDIPLRLVSNMIRFVTKTTTAGHVLTLALFSIQVKSIRFSI